jgi:hypothetical protein
MEPLKIKCPKCGELVERVKTVTAYHYNEPMLVCLECHDKIMDECRKEYGEL